MPLLERVGLESPADPGPRSPDRVEGQRCERRHPDRSLAAGHVADRGRTAVADDSPDPDVLAGYLDAAGLEPEDIWTEERRRVVTPRAYGSRMEAVGSHLWSDLPADDQAAAMAAMYELFDGAAGPDGAYRYSFVKTYAVARRR